MVWSLTRASHFDPVRELLAAGQPALMAGAANDCLQLLMAHKAGEERQIHCCKGRCGSVRLQGTEYQGKLWSYKGWPVLSVTTCSFMACTPPNREHV